LRGDAKTPVTDSSKEEKDIVEEDTESSGEWLQGFILQLQ
jgi:hypothetical protein